MIRIGHGFDIHRLTPNEEGGIVLAGVWIPWDKSFVAHSDGDVVYHAITDAILGALALGDIGQWFPDTDPQYKGVSSDVFLREVFLKAKQAGFKLGNVDVTIIAERPKLSPHIQGMRDNLSPLLEASSDQISIKAKTHEKCDALGKQEAIAAHVVIVLLPT